MQTENTLPFSAGAVANNTVTKESKTDYLYHKVWCLICDAIRKMYNDHISCYDTPNMQLLHKDVVGDATVELLERYINKMLLDQKKHDEPYWFNISIRSNAIMTDNISELYSDKNGRHIRISISATR